MCKLKLCVFSIILFQCAFAQQIKKYRKDSSDLQNSRQSLITIDLHRKYAGEQILPFNKIVVQDVRFDTTTIGIYFTYEEILYPVINNYKLGLSDGLAGSLNKYFNNFFSNNLNRENTELVCFFKRFYVSGRDTILENIKAKESIAQISVAAEVFFKTGSLYFGAFKIDTIIIARIDRKNINFITEINDKLIMPLLNAFAQKMILANANFILQKKGYPDTVVEKNYLQKRFDLPILKDPVLIRGIYKNFEEFKENKPSITVFKVKQEKYKSVSLYDSADNYINSLHVFGFCDGNQCWIQRGNFCNPLIRSGNSFEFYWRPALGWNLKLLACIDMDSGSFF